MQHVLFVYGTLMDPEVRDGVLGRHLDPVPDALREYERGSVAIGDEVYPYLISAEHGRVEGLRLEVSEEELKKFDEYEVSFYKRVEVLLESGKLAWVYVRK